MGIQQAILEEHEPVRHLLTVDEFLILDRAGAFEEIGRVELIDGEIFVLSPLFRPHGLTVVELTVAFRDALRKIDSPLVLYAGVSAHLDLHNLPEADLVIATKEDDDFASLSSVRLLVEVSYSSLRYDLNRKAKLYARTEVPEYWVADVKGRKIIRMSAPRDHAYTARDEFPFGAAVASAIIPNLVVDTRDLA